LSRKTKPEGTADDIKCYASKHDKIMRNSELHLLLPLEQVPPEQTAKPHLLCHCESVLSISVAGDGKTVADLYPVSASKIFT
jgi:hypothetical protein